MKIVPLFLLFAVALGVVGCNNSSTYGEKVSIPDDDRVTLSTSQDRYGNVTYDKLSGLVCRTRGDASGPATITQCFEPGAAPKYMQKLVEEYLGKKHDVGFSV